MAACTVTDTSARCHQPGFACRSLRATELAAVLSDFETISLSGLEETKAGLLTRVESKHLMTVAQCRDLVQQLSGSYRVLEVHNIKIGRYETMYLDNSSFVTYLEHHNGKANRFKLRFRHYESSKETYLEVKKKTSKGATEKTRMKTIWTPYGFLPEQGEFLESAFPFRYQEFRPVLMTVYDRFTLVSRDFPERITFDIGVSFNNGERGLAYPELVIAEAKYEKGVRNSPALLALHGMVIRKRSFSKYCIGVSLLYDRLKHNRFKANHLYLDRLCPGGGVTC